jgi:hypothetical protein
MFHYGPLTEALAGLTNPDPITIFQQTATKCGKEKRKMCDQPLPDLECN